ncbi:MAG: hypothetical protein AB8G05_10045 [Oligoflexales bacterium]
MRTVVQIRNNLPLSVSCEGVYFKETKDLSMNELMMFFDRDFFQMRKKHPKVEFLISLISRRGDQQIRVEASVAGDLNAKHLGEEIERVLWSYNHQHLHAKNGCLVPSNSRFTYKINISYRNEDQKLSLIAGGLHA